MITAEDYNIGPLTAGTNILKVTSINRVSSGISKYFELSDVSGKYSSTDIFAKDGILYRENKLTSFEEIILRLVLVNWYVYTEGMNMNWEELQQLRDEIIKIVKFPEIIQKIGSISLSDTNHFAFITDTTFYIYNNHNFKRIDYGVFNDGYIPLNYINIIYKPKENQIISGVLTYTKRTENELDYSSYFLNIYDLNSMTSSLIPFSYPEQFHGNKLGIPKVYLSELDDDLLVSFELDDNVYKIDLKTNKIDTILCKSRSSNIHEAFFPTDGDKQSKVDAIQKNNLNVGGYGMAFLNKNKIYRLYRPGLPIQDQDGNYFNSTDKGAHILELDLSNNRIKEIQLANGQYYVPIHWSFNRFNNCLIYPKLEEHVTKKNLCFYNIHSISVYNQ
jgi:hypothetical protein